MHGSHFLMGISVLQSAIEGHARPTAILSVTSRQPYRPCSGWQHCSLTASHPRFCHPQWQQGSCPMWVLHRQPLQAGGHTVSNSNPTTPGSPSVAAMVLAPCGFPVTRASSPKAELAWFPAR